MKNFQIKEDDSNKLKLKKMINRFLTDIKIIKNAINTKKLVIFAGAGISIDAGVPSWGKLIAEIKKELDLPDYENDYLKIPQIYYNERQEKEYVEKIRNVLVHKKIKHNEIHEEIFELNPEHILTTNFEDLLEQVINKNSLPFSVVKQDEDLPYSNNTKLLVKIHGDLDNTNFVLKEDDYLNYSANHPLIEAFINSIFASKVVLFIGYSFSDYNLKQIVQNVRNILGNNFQSAYLLSIDEKLHSSHRQYLKNKGINVIDYHEARITNNNDKNVNFIETFLNGKNVYSKKYYKKGSDLSDKGQLLLNFLRFIRFYNDSEVEITKENVIDIIYDSLSRFSELKSLPQNFISKLYPFKISKEPEYLIQKTTLLLKNKIVRELFYERIEIEKNQVKYLPNIRQKEECERKLYEIVKKLNNSLIFHLTAPKRSGAFSKEAIDITLNHEINCDCSKCKFNKFKLKEALKELQSYSINETSDIKEDMQKAYLNYKYGNYLQSFKMYEEIASKSWQIGKYISYYIAKKNMKSLNVLINYNELNIEEEEKGKVISKIEDIDADKLIFQIPYKSDEEYELLKIIRDDSIFSKYKDKIDDLYNKVEEIYIGYKSLYYNTHGPYYPQLIYIELHKILNFYIENHIIIDIFSDFKKHIQKGLEGLLLSHITSENYQGKLEKLSSNFFKLSLVYYNSKSLFTFLNSKHKVEKLKFGEKDLSGILVYSSNFFESFYDDSSFSSSYKNQQIFNQLDRDIFEGNMRRIFKNIFIILLFVDIPKDRSNRFIDSLIPFLEHENFLIHDTIKYFLWFFEKNYSLFSFENCKSILKIAQNKIHKYESNEGIAIISFVINKNNYALIEDRDYIFKIVNDYEYYDSNISIIPYLWKISSDDIKKELKEKLINQLQLNFNDEIYKTACFEELIDYNLFFEDYIKKINTSRNSNNEIYTLKNGKPRVNNFSLINFILFIYNMKIKSDDERLEQFKNLPNSIKFLLFRDRFDLGKFKVEWLFLIDREIIFNELKTIKGLKEIIQSSLKNNFDEKLSIIYTKYFI